VSVLVVGDIVTDILAIHSGALVVGSDNAARISQAGGGSGANAAAWLAYAGATVHMVAVAGTDLAGTDRLAELAAAGVGCAAVRRTDEAPTGSVIVLVHGQDRTMLTDRGASRLLAPSDVDSAFALLPGLRHVHLSGYTLLGEERSRVAGVHALRLAARRGLTTSVDAASSAPLARVGPAAFLSWVRGADLLLANQDEARVLAPGFDSTMDSARALTSIFGQVVVKEGPVGAVWATRGGSPVAAPALPATVVDPTGAGDAFAAGLLTAWLAGLAPADSLRAGTRLGAEAVSLLGGRPPTGAAAAGPSGLAGASRATGA
jgi:sugar/nucleoside kinase (ribokinase family)